MVTYNSSVTAVYIEVIADIKCHFHILHSEENLYKRDVIKLSKIYSPLFTFSDLSCPVENSSLNVNWYLKTEAYNSKVWLRLIPEKYASIMVIYCPFNYLALLGNNSWHPMLDFHNENSVAIYTGPYEKISSIYVRVFGNLQHISHLCLDLIYRWHQISASYFTLGENVYTRKTP